MRKPSESSKGASKLTLSSMPRVETAGRGLIRSPHEAWENQASLYVNAQTEDDLKDMGGHADSRYADDDDDAGSDGYDYNYDDDEEDEVGATPPRLRATSAARPLRSQKARLMTAAALERLERQAQSSPRNSSPRGIRPDLSNPRNSDPRLDALSASGRQRALAPVAAPALATASVPDLPAFRPLLARRPRLNTQRIIESARSPWSLTRIALTLAAILAALVLGFSHMGEPTQPLQATGFQSQVSSQANGSLASMVRPETQGKRPDLYDSQQQFNDWWDAACSAAALSEILTAYGVPHATIGEMIDELGPDISLSGGLINMGGFERVAAMHGLRADEIFHPTYNQMLYITNTLGLPLIVNVRISYGYYHFFSGGHFLVMTGGDSAGLSIVDSSEYYIHYLPLDVFNSMFTGRTVVIVPATYHYTLPAN
ncbi:MAG TPA: hypothetical protein VKQ36_11365 [Ktedonobacterales bacterium]|nr:hypothetical protein [Ktedonobacterales bacterium]